MIYTVRVDRSSSETGALYFELCALVSLSHLDASPERNVTLNLVRIGFSRRVIPRGILVHLPLDNDVVVTRFAFPSADRVGMTPVKELFVNGIGRKY